MAVYISAKLSVYLVVVWLKTVSEMRKKHQLPRSNIAIQLYTLFYTLY